MPGLPSELLSCCQLHNPDYAGNLSTACSAACCNWLGKALHLFYDVMLYYPSRMTPISPGHFIGPRHYVLIANHQGHTA